MTTTVAPVPTSIAPALKILEEMAPVRETHIIPLLQRLQEAYGYLPRDVILDVAARTRLPVSRIYGVATFYEQFNLKPRGRHLIRCCRGTACHVKGGKQVAEAIRNALRVEEGDTTPDRRYTFETVACLGTCFLAPVVMVNNDYHSRVVPAEMKSILDRYS